MKKIYTICAALLITVFAGVDMLHAQDAEPVPVTIRDLNSYESPITSKADLEDNLYVDSLFVFEAVVVSYPKNSGLASMSDGIPNRIHVFVTDVNAAEMGPEGMSAQLVVSGASRTTMEALLVGDVIRVVGELSYFSGTAQVNSTDVELIGSVFTDDEYQNLESFLQPTLVTLEEINVPSDVTPGLYRWNRDNYTNIVNRYVRIEGLEVIGRLDAPTGRPYLVLTDGTSIITTTDVSLRYRNDLNLEGRNYPGAELNYNWRRLDESLDGAYSPPPAGAIVDIQGYIVVNNFNPLQLDESPNTQSTFKIAPWDDGIVWTQDGTNTDFRITEGINNDLVVVGFPALIDNVELDVEAVTSADEATLSADILLPENDYTLNSVSLTYNTSIFTSDESSDNVTAEMTGSGDTYSFTFDSFADFTVVNYTITAVATTPDGIETTGRLTGSFDVVNSAVTSPVVFSPAAGTYENIVEVELSTPTEGATIYYTTDGSEPTTASTEYTGAISLTETATVRAIAKSAELEASPVNSRTYTVVIAATEVSTMAALRAAFSGDTQEVFSFTGDAVVTYARPGSGRNQKFLMDSTGGLLIDDSRGVITSTYAVGDIMTGLMGTISPYNQLRQLLPTGDVPNSGRTTEVVPFVVTIPEVTAEDHESALITLNNVRFETEDTSFPASGGRNYTVVDSEGNEIAFRTAFNEADYMGQAIPTSAFNLTALVGNFNGTFQLTARSTADFNFDVSNERFDGAYEFQLTQNYPNPFNPSTSISYSVAEMTNVTLTVYDILGRVVATLVNDVHSPGQYNVNFDAARLSSGTYIYRIEAGDFMSTKKMLLIK